MPIALVGHIVVTAATFLFGFLMFRGMLLEWHRRDGELSGRS